MPSIRMAFLLVFSALPAAAGAKPWQGISPGVTTQAEVITRFGEPSTQGQLGGRTALVYKDDQAIAGTRQAQFFLREDGKVAEITVFPAAQLDKDAVEGTYGKSPQKTFTDDFRPVWVYRSTGVLVFFGKDGMVEAISFRPAEAAKPAPGPREPAAAPARDKAGAAR